MAKSSFSQMIIFLIFLGVIIENGMCQVTCSSPQVYNPLTNACEGTCPSGEYYWAAPNGQDCWPIGPFYGNCISAWWSPNNTNVQCTQCGNGAYLSSAEFPTCIGGCPPGCSTCDGDTCNSCIAPNYYLYNSSQCVTACPNTTIATTTAANGPVCLTCPSNCEMCVSGYVCTACQVGYLLLSHGYVKYIDAYSCVPEIAAANPCPPGYSYGHYKVPNGTIIYGSDGSSACIATGSASFVADPNPNPYFLVAAKNKKRFNLRQD